ncbi:MAG TPA: tripartite tricarboxylate transporter substrate binding protein [Burkholderiales bacterium]|nr:tripartite tricarboxylate transporter substrate binding protein [Burkholderiales bacterium]
MIGILFAVIAHAVSYAQNRFPSKPLRLIVPFAPSGGQDTVARVLGHKLTQMLGQQVVVDNRPGGSGILAAESLLKSPPDGHTLYLVSTSFVVAPALRKSLPFDPLKDFTAVSRIATSPGALVVHSSLPAKTLKQLIQLARAQPGRITFGSAGVASQSHLSGELFKVLAGIDLLHVPYRGAAQAVNALYAGDTDLMVTGMGEAMPHLRDRRLRAIAITGARRLAELPEVPAAVERVPGFVLFIWYGFLGPRATPPAVVQRLATAIAPLRQGSGLAQRLQGSGVELLLSPPEVLAERMEREVPQWKRVVAAANIRVE